MGNWSKTCAWIFGTIYLFAWMSGLLAFLLKANFDALFLLAIYTLPSSLLVSEISHAAGGLLNFSNDARAIVDFIGFLVFGVIQYFLMGYIFGIVTSKMRELIIGLRRK